MLNFFLIERNSLIYFSIPYAYYRIAMTLLFFADYKSISL